MAMLVANCPRCGARQITFDTISRSVPIGVEYRWKHIYEICCLCRNCERPTIFVIGQKNINDSDWLQKNDPSDIKKSLNDHFSIERFIGLVDHNVMKAPEFTPDDIAAIFKEAATSANAQCWNATGAMCRKIIDIATIPMLPTEDVEGLNSKTRRDLGLRLPWLFNNSILSSDLRELSSCVHQDGNDAAHSQMLGKEDADDLLDFTVALLERIYTERGRLQRAESRRLERRKPKE